LQNLDPPSQLVTEVVVAKESLFSSLKQAPDSSAVKGKLFRNPKKETIINRRIPTLIPLQSKEPPAKKQYKSKNLYCYIERAIGPSANLNKLTICKGK